MGSGLSRAIFGTAIWLGMSTGLVSHTIAQQPAAAPPAKVAAPPAVAKPDVAPAARLSEWPKLVPSAEPKKVPERWSEAEIAEAQKSCVSLLKGLDIVAVGATPHLDGSECGFLES